eukprot:2802296-Rhodomonas_salina.1
MTDGESTATPSCERQRAGRRMRTSARSAGGTTETGKGTRGETGTGIERGSGGVKRSQAWRAASESGVHGLGVGRRPGRERPEHGHRGADGDGGDSALLARQVRRPPRGEVGFDQRMGIETRGQMADGAKRVAMQCVRRHESEQSLSLSCVCLCLCRLFGGGCVSVSVTVTVTGCHWLCLCVLRANAGRAGWAEGGEGGDEDEEGEAGARSREEYDSDAESGELAAGRRFSDDEEDWPATAWDGDQAGSIYDQGSRSDTPGARRRECLALQIAVRCMQKKG